MGKEEGREGVGKRMGVKGREREGRMGKEGRIRDRVGGMKRREDGKGWRVWEKEG